MPIDVLAFAGSPRRHGNSETLLDWVLDAMGSHDDVTVEKVPLTEADVNFCRGCNACERLNHCVQRDGMDYLHDRIIEADAIILAAPIYCMGICAQAKALIDRAQVFRSRKYVLGLPVVPPERKGKRLAAFLSTAGQDWEHVFDGAIPSVKCFFHVIDIFDRDIRYLLVRDVDEKGAIEQRPDTREDAARLAEEMVDDLRRRLGGGA
ncbi:MAG: flavodoxin family protein [Methanomicrobiales archaeon]